MEIKESNDRNWVVVRQSGFGAKINLAASQLPEHARVMQCGGY
ncbi:MAG: hypothetical protein ABJN65_12080 [Parasphingorhabdus sp.]